MKGKFFAVVALLLGGASAWFLFFRPEKPSLTLDDGTILTLEKVNYGPKQTFVLDPWKYRLQKVIDHLPAWLSRKLPRVYGWPASWGGGQLPLPNDDALYVWLTRRDPHSGHHVDTDVHWAEIVDEHGCPFIAAHVGGMTYHRGQGVKGYEVGPEQHVMLTDDELDAFAAEATKRIDILDFVDLKDIAQSLPVHDVAAVVPQVTHVDFAHRATVSRVRHGYSGSGSCQMPITLPSGSRNVATVRSPSL